MALIQVNYLSKALFRTVPLNVILPVDKFMGSSEQKPFKTLYLLHGLLGNYTDWISGTKIQRWAEDRNLCVVMPSGDNSFYVDNAVSKNGEFIGRELVEMTRKMFHLSDKREDTFIAGLSMGGFGALRNGLKYNDTFGYIAGLSSAVHIFEREADPTRNMSFEDGIFEGVENARLTDKNPRNIVNALAERKAAGENVNLPKVYMCCGTEDGLMDVNVKFKDLLLENGFDVTWEIGPGNHNWDFWNTYIERILDWLPLDEAKMGLSSENVQKKD